MPLGKYVDRHPRGAECVVFDPLNQTSEPHFMRGIFTQVESAVLRHLTLLQRLQDVHLRPEEAQVLMQRVATNTCSAEDRDRLAQVIRATTQVADQLLAPSPLPEQAAHGRSSPERKTKRKRQLAKASRRRNWR